MQPVRCLLLLCAASAALAICPPRSAQAQGCTAARGCPTIAPTIPGSLNLAMFDVFAQQEPEQLDVAPDAVEPRYSISDYEYQETSGFLAPGKLIVSYQWNFADAEHIYLRDDNLPDADQAVALTSIQNEHVLGFELGLAERLSFVYELPFLYNNRSLNVDPISSYLTGRLIQKNGGLADSRMYLRYWLGECEDHNVSLLAGVKVPTGYEASGYDYQGTFLYDDVSIQTGTGSWDPLLGIFFYRRTGYWTWFGSFNYRLSPASTTRALALDPLLADPNSTVLNSVPDQFNGDLGFTWAIGQWMADEGGCCSPAVTGLALNFAVVEAAVPKHDIINDSDGYRRAFNALFLRPGFLWTPKADVSIYGNFPVTVDRNLLVPGSFPEISFSFGGLYRW